MENQTFRLFTEGQLKTFHVPHNDYTKVKQFNLASLTNILVRIRLQSGSVCLFYPRIKELPTLAGSFPYIPCRHLCWSFWGRTAFPIDFLLAWHNTQAQPEPIGAYGKEKEGNSLRTGSPKGFSPNRTSGQIWFHHADWTAESSSETGLLFPPGLIPNPNPPKITFSGQGTLSFLTCRS